MAAIKVSNLTKFYGDFKAIDSVSFSVKQGSVYGYLGPNGAGKTTTIRTMLGLLKPNEGEVQIAGLNPIEHPVKCLQNVGYVPELPDLPPFYTGENLLGFTGKMFGLSQEVREEKVQNLLEVVGLEEHRSKKVGKYSKGMVQRLAVGLALINDPSVLIMDEPTLGMDPGGAAHFRDLFTQLSGEGKTLFLSSHLLDEVQRLCTHVGVINWGEIRFKGTIEELSETFTPNWVVEVELTEASPSIIDTLRNLDYVKNVTVKGKMLSLELREKKDWRSEISSEVFEQGGKIVSMNLRKASLEDAYLRAVGRGEQK
ncbi:MAG: ABC transporter ATP-binding protein [Candidatus Korarchaeota archaeon]|nr:ABC transporter ATP-binding protein [Candidatus Korarchaeota archaeon]NIU83703.1 ATP-binding cassette domain-containing protein [Candidatus Thorarchaeota archaeon]NIW14888.1 ATP-binding cassette domain-containing protein [Candidatus Thorarchaeota archaeon]NIW52020.1 ATP-binding cassette domain-containing protein [Candidatus Korarchaeota archaeon]